MKLPREGLPIHLAVGIGVLPAFVMTLFKSLSSQLGVLEIALVIAVLAIICLLSAFVIAKAFKTLASSDTSASQRKGRFPHGKMPWKEFFVAFPVVAIGSVAFFSFSERDRFAALLLAWGAMLVVYFVMRMIVRASPDRS